MFQNLAIICLMYPHNLVFFVLLSASIAIQCEIIQANEKLVDNILLQDLDQPNSINNEGNIEGGAAAAPLQAENGR